VWRWAAHPTDRLRITGSGCALGVTARRASWPPPRGRRPDAGGLRPGGLV
jgi:hypothetical protein